MFSFTWNAPPDYPHVRRQRTWVVVLLKAFGEEETEVELFHLGWGTGLEWDEVYAYFERAWHLVLERLKHRFAEGPIDWENPWSPGE